MKKERDIYPELFFHSVKYNFDYLLEILAGGYVFSKDKSPYKNTDISFLGDKVISFYKYQDGIGIDEVDYYEDNRLVYSGFNNYIVDHIGLVFRNLLVLPTFNTSIIYFSDIGDEFQAYEKISLEDLVGILYPKLLMQKHNKETYDKDYPKLVEFLKEKEIKVPILDSSKEMIQEEVKRLHKSLF